MTASDSGVVLDRCVVKWHVQTRIDRMAARAGERL